MTDAWLLVGSKSWVVEEGETPFKCLIPAENALELPPLANELNPGLARFVTALLACFLIKAIKFSKSSGYTAWR